MTAVNINALHVLIVDGETHYNHAASHGDCPLYNVFSQYGYVHEVGIFRHGNRGFLVSMVYKLLCPAEGALSDDARLSYVVYLSLWRLTSVAYIRPKSRTQEA